MVQMMEPTMILCFVIASETGIASDSVRDLKGAEKRS